METGPPPGGYGLHAPPPKEELPKPFRTRAPTPVRSRRWIGFSVLGLALVGVRVALLLAREPPKYDFDPGSLGLPELTSTVGGLTAPVTLGSLAVDDRGHSYFIKNGKLWTQQNDGTPVLHFAGQGDIRDVAVGFRNVFVIDSVGVERISEFGEADTVATGDFSGIAIDGSDAIVLGKTSIQRVYVGKKSISTLVSLDPAKDLVITPPLAVSNGFVWFGMSGGVGRAPKNKHTIVSAPYDDRDANGLAPSPAGVFAATSEGLFELGGDEPRTVSVLGCRDVVSIGKYAYVSRVDDAGWAVSRVTETGVESIVHTTAQPRLTARDGMVYWSTTEGVRSAPHRPSG